jgi:MFS family permease
MGSADHSRGSASAAAQASARLPWALAWRLSLGQLVAWGILYYAFTVVVGPMQAATGWSRTFLNAGLSVGLLMWGLMAVPVGAWIQRRGGRELMAGASALGGAAFMLMGWAPDRAVYIGAWLMVGVAMAGLLYDAAFAVVTQAFGAEYRRGITLITLVGGLASTVFIPTAQIAVDRLGWQDALVVLGAFQVLLGMPLHLWGVPRRKLVPATQPPAALGARWSDWWREFSRDVSDPRFVGLVVWFTAHAAAFTGLIFQLVPILQTLDVDNATILKAIAIIGPMQVLGRFVLTTRGSHFSSLRVGRWAMCSLASAMLILLLLPPHLVWLACFAALYGVGNGVLTILRGTSIAELFGRERYPELNGALSAPAVFAKAAAPLAMAGLWSATAAPKVVFAGVLALVVAGLVGLWLATTAQRRHAAAIVSPIPPAP